MLKRMYVDNYRCLVNFELALDDLTLLLGPNGVGKSSVFDVLFALRQLLCASSKVTDRDVFPGHTLTRWQSRSLQTIEIDVDLEGDALTYRLEIEHDTKERRARILREELKSTGTGKPLFSFVDGEVQLYRNNHSAGPRFPADWSTSDLGRVPPRTDNTRLTRFLDFMRKLIICGIYPRSFATESTTEDTLLAPDGANFCGWYRHIFQERQDLVPAYHQALSEVVEGFKGIRLEKVGLEARALVGIFEDENGRYELKLDEISDGQCAAMALYALVYLTAGQGYTLLLDEPDNYLALSEIQPWLVALKDACDDSNQQAILSSHHPELMDYLGSDRGVFLQRERSGIVTAKPPSVGATKGGLKLSEIVARGWER